jgi:RNA polymerase sigma-70 factor (ECF subfamily)
MQSSQPWNYVSPYSMVSTMPPGQAVSRTSDEAPLLMEFIRRVGNADQGALGELYDATSPMVFGLIRRIVDDSSVAEEITLDVYSQVWRIAPTYSRDKGSPLTWLLMLARSRAIDHLRSSSRRLKDREEPIEVAFDCAHPGPDPETTAISGNRRQVVQAILADLAPEQITLLKLAFFEGLSHGEIAKKTGMPLGTVKSRIRAGMLRMRELLEGQEGIR